MRHAKLGGMVGNPTVGRWQLAHELRTLRGDRTATAVAQSIRVANSSVTRWEDPAGMLPREKDLRDLLAFYAVTSEQADKLLALRKQARESGWWQSYAVAREYSTYLGLESEATEIETWESALIPGLLQTGGYAQAIIQATQRSESDDVERDLEVRKTRQENWLRRGGPTLHAIVAEAAVRQEVGGSEVMRTQLEKLIELSEHPRCHFQVLPYSAGAHRGMRLPAAVILTLSHVGLAAVYTEGQSSSLFLTGADDLAHHVRTFNALRVAALGIEATRKFLREAVNSA